MDRETATRRFYALVWPHAAAMLRVARILCRDDGEAEDLTQESMLKAFRSIDRFDGGGDARKWLFTILRNARIDRVRAQRGGPREVAFDPIAEQVAQPTQATETGRGGTTSEQILEAFSDQEIIDALRKVPEEMRWTVLLVDVEGLDYSEAAGVLGTPTGTVKSRAHRGRAMLRLLLSPLARDRRLLKQAEEK